MSPSPFNPCDNAARLLLLSVQREAERVTGALASMLGQVPPVRVCVAESDGPASAWLDEAGALNLAPGYAAVNEAPAVPLLSALVEGWVRWAMTLRIGASPQMLRGLESEQGWHWGGFSVWLASRGGLPAAALGPATEQGDVLPIARWGRGGYRLWRVLERRQGVSRMVAMAEALVGSDVDASAAAALSRLARRLGPEGWGDVAKALYESLQGDDWVPIGMGVPDLQVGGVVGAGGMVVVDVEASPSGAAQLEMPEGVALLKAEGDPWASLESDVEGDGLLLLACSEGGPWRLHRTPSPLLGDWYVSGADFAGQVFGVRGLGVRFEADGRLSLDLGDAFVGALNKGSLSMAGQVGITGDGHGTWAMEEGQLQLRNLEAGELVIHARSDSPLFGLPSAEAEDSAAFFARSIESVPWQVDARDDTVVLRSRFGGIPANLRLSRTEREDIPTSQLP